jgi:hypothetical protein
MDPKVIVKWIAEFTRACAWSLTAINLGLRNGEAARDSVLKPESPWAAAIEFWFELAVTWKPLADELGPQIQNALIAALLAAAADTINGFMKGLKASK